MTGEHADGPGGTGARDDVVLDARGLRCPVPVVRLARLARELPAGSRVTVLWTDPAAEHDVPAWARMRGHVTLGTQRHADHGATTVRLG